METRNILNYSGDIIGVMEMPDGTSEESWAEALGHYCLPPASPPSMQEVIEAKISEAEAFGRLVVFDAKVGNVAQGITQAGKTKEVSDYLRMVARYLNEGSLYAAVAALDEMIVLEIPADISTWVSVDRLKATKNRIQDFLKIPRT